MGIPSYFSYIIKNHSRIISNLQGLRREGVQFHSLLMDCNSIVYDVARTIEYTPLNKQAYETELISSVIVQIRKIIQSIQPSGFAYVAFDGVAPFAKMKQQRTRRYKSYFMSTRVSSTQIAWNTANITPGTHFMETLSSEVQNAFASTPQVIVSASNEVGEGEHKMFAYLRNLPKDTIKNTNVAVYGLDSDLIMLSIFHKPYVHNIHIFREAPSFSKSVLPPNLHIQPDEPLFLNTHKLTQSILKEMGCATYTLGRVYDYVFLCFLLGNDFLPHFISLNLRTNGLHLLLQAYAQHIATHPTRGFIDPVSLHIQWKWVFHLFTVLAKSEHQTILDEFQNRERLQTQTANGYSHSAKFTEKTQETIWENAPILLRGEEEYISPKYDGWEARYYAVALECEYTPENRNRVCANYLEGLEWVFRYYTHECPHWRWVYNYHYPPLLKDLAQFSDRPSSFLQQFSQTNKPFLSKVQLAYVIPRMQFDLLPPDIRKVVDAETYHVYYPDVDTLPFTWIGCRYFWEAHIHLPTIPLSTLDTWEQSL